MDNKTKRTIACKQLNYRYREITWGRFLETLIADGQLDGRNWSIVKVQAEEHDIKAIRRHISYHLRVDVSEYTEAIKAFSHTLALRSKLAINYRDRGVQFAINNCSPGIWENGFNPNYWLSLELGSCSDEESHILEVLKTGFDVESMTSDQILDLVGDLVEQVKPAIKMLKSFCKPGTPYRYWYGYEPPPPPREPQW